MGDDGGSSGTFGSQAYPEDDAHGALPAAAGWASDARAHISPSLTRSASAFSVEKWCTISSTTAMMLVSVFCVLHLLLVLGLWLQEALAFFFDSE